MFAICRDALCPGPVIEVSRAIKRVALNGVLEVLATDPPGLVPDIQAFSKRTGHAVLHTEQDEVDVHVLIRRTPLIPPYPIRTLTGRRPRRLRERFEQSRQSRAR